jgi:hypothetical protein
MTVQAAGFLLLIGVLVRNSFRKSSRDNSAAQKLENLKASWRKALGFSARTK